MERHALADDVEDEELRPEAASQPRGVLAGAKGNLRAVGGNEDRRPFMNSGLLAFEDSGFRGRVEFRGDQDRPPRFAENPVESLPDDHTPRSPQNLRAETKERRLLFFEAEDSVPHFADGRAHPRPCSHGVLDLIRAGLEIPSGVAELFLRVGARDPDEFDLGADGPREARPEESRAPCVLEGAVADEHAIRRPHLLAFRHDQDRATRAVGESRGDAADHHAPESPHPPAARDDESRPNLLRVGDDPLDRATFDEARPGDGASRLLYPPRLLIERVTADLFESAPYEAAAVGGRHHSPYVNHVQFGPALLGEIHSRTSGRARAHKPIGRKQYLLRETVHLSIPFGSLFQFTASSRAARVHFKRFLHRAGWSDAASGAASRGRERANARLRPARTRVADVE